MVWACFQPQGVKPSNRQHLAVAASFGQAEAGRARAFSGKPASAQRARPNFAGSKPSQNSAASLPSSPTRWANSAASSVSLRAGKRSRATTGRFGPRPGANRPESCMMQMPESPYSVNCTSPVSRASTRQSAPSSRLAQPLARMPASDLRG